MYPANVDYYRAGSVAEAIRLHEIEGNPLDAESDGRVIALGDAARLEDVLEAMGGGPLHDHGH